jgi:hypothetical protein
MTMKKNEKHALQPPVIITPVDGETVEHLVRISGTGTPGNKVVGYSTSDSLHPIFMQSIPESGIWLTHIDLSKYEFYVCEKTLDESDISPNTPILTVKLK